jgi:hypothetical protein
MGAQQCEPAIRGRVLDHRRHRRLQFLGRPVIIGQTGIEHGLGDPGRMLIDRPIEGEKGRTAQGSRRLLQEDTHHSPRDSR